VLGSVLPLVVVTIVFWPFVVVAVTMPLVVVIVVVTGFEVEVPVGIRTTGLPLTGAPVFAGTTGPGPDAGGAVALDDVETVARVASTVASTTPDPARMAIALEFERPSAGGAI
jgi:hypothetical protein